MTTIEIRTEEPSDAARIRDITELAFRQAPHTCGREHLLVDALRKAGALSLSLVAVSPESGIVGHVAVSPVHLSGTSGKWFGIGPVSVLPSFQKQGIGSRLMRSALSRLRETDAAGCVLVGDLQYYGRFGFRSDPSLAVPDVPKEVTLALRFTANNDAGTVLFHPAFAEAGRPD